MSISSRFAAVFRSAHSDPASRAASAPNTASAKSTRATEEAKPSRQDYDVANDVLKAMRGRKETRATQASAQARMSTRAPVGNVKHSGVDAHACGEGLLAMSAPSKNTHAGALVGLLMDHDVGLIIDVSSRKQGSDPLLRTGVKRQPGTSITAVGTESLPKLDGLPGKAVRTQLYLGLMTGERNVPYRRDSNASHRQEIEHVRFAPKHGLTAQDMQQLAEHVDAFRTRNPHMTVVFRCDGDQATAHQLAFAAEAYRHQRHSAAQAGSQAIVKDGAAPNSTAERLMQHCKQTFVTLGQRALLSSEQIARTSQLLRQLDSVQPQAQPQAQLASRLDRAAIVSHPATINRGLADAPRQALVLRRVDMPTTTGPSVPTDLQPKRIPPPPPPRIGSKLMWRPTDAAATSPSSVASPVKAGPSLLAAAPSSEARQAATISPPEPPPAPPLPAFQPLTRRATSTTSLQLPEASRQPGADSGAPLRRRSLSTPIAAASDQLQDELRARLTVLRRAHEPAEASAGEATKAVKTAKRVTWSPDTVDRMTETGTTPPAVAAHESVDTLAPAAGRPAVVPPPLPPKPTALSQTPPAGTDAPSSRSGQIQAADLQAEIQRRARRSEQAEAQTDVPSTAAMRDRPGRRNLSTGDQASSMVHSTPASMVDNGGFLGQLKQVLSERANKTSELSASSPNLLTERAPLLPTGSASRQRSPATEQPDQPATLPRRAGPSVALKPSVSQHSLPRRSGPPVPPKPVSPVRASVQDTAVQDTAPPATVKRSGPPVPPKPPRRDA